MYSIRLGQRVDVGLSFLRISQLSDVNSYLYRMNSKDNGGNDFDLTISSERLKRRFDAQHHHQSKANGNNLDMEVSEVQRVHTLHY